jgi:hypothetical protein
MQNYTKQGGRGIMPIYNPNFEKGTFGNSLVYGNDLVVKIEGKPVYIIGQLFERKSFGRKKLIQIEQTGSRGNPERDQITLEMKKPDGSPMNKGKYTVRTYCYIKGRGGNSWTDKFEVI